MLKGKCLLTQIIMGGRTQFLTKVHGMPDHIRKALTKLIREFIWGNNKRQRLALETLHSKKEEGGIELLNLKNQNEAIELVWLKEYLHATDSRPLWAHITDILLNKTAPMNLHKNA